MLPHSLLLSFLASTVLASPLGSQARASNSSRIAIIGAGAGGSSAAFWISKAKERYGLDVKVDIYERNNYIGGRMSFDILPLLTPSDPYISPLSNSPF